MSYGLRIYVVGDSEGYKIDNLHSTAEVSVRKEAQRIAKEGLWKTDNEFIPPSQIRSILLISR